MSSGNTKHINQKYYYARDLIQNKIISLRYCPSHLMIADILTKPLEGVLFSKIRDRLMNKDEQDEDYNDEVYKLLYEGIHDISKLNEDEKKFIDIFACWLNIM